ncbi:MAG: phosphoenolpyruvate--protein phosphotransferase [Spirochaetes bacterium]|nr:phosphoenolpyruvate--protein phosphotransferase [Spirochaetota bacterium]
MVLRGKGTAQGFAVGRIYIYNEKFNTPAEKVVPVGKEQAQLDYYYSIKKEALNELDKIKRSLEGVDPLKAEIFDAHKEIVEDIIINEEIPARILNDHWAGDWAIYHVYGTVIAVLKKTADPLIAERAADFDDVRAMLLRLWYGQKTNSLSELKEPSIIVAHEIKPSGTAGINNGKVLAILTEEGGVTSHAAIIAKSFGIPAVLGIDGLLNYAKQGQYAAVDAMEGAVILDPEEDTIKDYRKRSDDFSRARKDAEVFLKKESRTACGEKIDIGLNISSANDSELHAQSYADSVGLFRTEFLFLGHSSLPSEEDQFNSYRKVLKSFGKKPVILRVLDIGGDKQISTIEQKKEDNSFLGNRGIRFCFSYPDIFITQLRAAFRASTYGNLWIMLPMIGSLDDIKRAKEIIEETKNKLIKEKFQIGDVKIGIMIEVPSIALIADLAAKEVDFASIGSNDLCQYVCAADRMNAVVEDYYQSYHPAIFKLIKETVEAFKRAEKPISICGEMGGDPLAVSALIGCGLRKFSMGAASIAAVKRAIAGITVARAEEISQKMLELSTAEEIESFLNTSYNTN